jgi:hypothetical protein
MPRWIWSHVTTKSDKAKSAGGVVGASHTGECVCPSEVIQYYTNTYVQDEDIEYEMRGGGGGVVEV